MKKFLIFFPKIGGINAKTDREMVFMKNPVFKISFVDCNDERIKPACVVNILYDNNPIRLLKKKCGKNLIFKSGLATFINLINHNYYINYIFNYYLIFILSYFILFRKIIKYMLPIWSNWE